MFLIPRLCRFSAAFNWSIQFRILLNQAVHKPISLEPNTTQSGRTHQLRGYWIMNLLDYIWFQTDWFMNLPDWVFVIDLTIFYPAWMGKVLNWLIHEPAWLDKILKWRMGFPELQGSCSHTKTSFLLPSHNLFLGQ